MNNKRRIFASSSSFASAFTLIELLLVLVILAVLAAVVVPKFTNRSVEARITAAKADIASIDLALDTFEVDNGRFPTNEEGLAALVQAPASAKSWKGPYLKKMPNDPWGQPYAYKYPGQHNTSGYDLYSMGPTGQGETEINNWSTN